MVEEDKEETKMDWKTPLIVIGAIMGVGLIIGFFVLFSSSGITENAINKNYQDNGVDENSPSQISENSLSKKNCRQEQVPYEEQETYYETIPYTDQECFTRPINFNYDYKDLDGNGGADGFLITNYDSEEGIFKFQQAFIKYGTSCPNALSNQYDDCAQVADSFSQVSQIFLTGNENKIVEFTSIEDHWSVAKVWSDEIIESCENIIKSQEVQRTRTITKYRTEEVCN